MYQLIGGIVGLVGQAAGGYTSAEQSRSAYQYNATVADFNATLAELKAIDAVERGGAQQQQVSRGARQLKGKQIAAASRSGISIRSGSMLSTLLSSDVMEAKDLDTIRDNTTREVFQYETEATQARIDADVQRTMAETTDPFAASLSSTSGSAGQLVSLWKS